MHAAMISRLGGGCGLDLSALPSNAAREGIAAGLAAATEAGGGKGAVMVMVVQPGEKNAYDQQVSVAPGTISVQLNDALNYGDLLLL